MRFALLGENWIGLEGLACTYQYYGIKSDNTLHNLNEKKQKRNQFIDWPSRDTLTGKDGPQWAFSHPFKKN